MVRLPFAVAVVMLAVPMWFLTHSIWGTLMVGLLGGTILWRVVNHREFMSKAEWMAWDIARNSCAKCGRTRDDIHRDFMTMRDVWTGRRVEVIGSGDVLLYCTNCEKSFCGRCQVDLGMSSGCPVCGKALD